MRGEVKKQSAFKEERTGSGNARPPQKPRHFCHCPNMTQEHTHALETDGRQRWGPEVSYVTSSLSPLPFPIHSSLFLSLLTGPHAAQLASDLLYSQSFDLLVFLLLPKHWTGMTGMSCHKGLSFFSMTCKVSRWQQKRKVGESGGFLVERWGPHKRLT